MLTFTDALILAALILWYHLARWIIRAGILAGLAKTVKAQIEEAKKNDG